MKGSGETVVNSRVTMATGYELPQMKSIWLDEDQEAEKLYAQQFMGSDEEESIAIKTVNSDKPLLNNKKKIHLKPLEQQFAKNVSIASAPSPKKKFKKKSFFAFLKGKDHAKPQKISTPFAFQHISHANTKDGFESGDEDVEFKKKAAEDESGKVHSPFHKSFVTQSIPSECKESFKINQRKRASVASRRSLSGSISTISSSRSRSSAGRIVSSSTMATSIQQDSSSPSRLTLLNTMENTCFKDRSTRDSKDSGSSIEFLRNYDFPTLLEVKSSVDVCADEDLDVSTTNEAAAIENDAVKKQNAEEVDSVSPLPKINRARSDSNLISTPVIENSWYEESTPATRKSVDDILLCYHVPSDAGSFLPTPFSSPTKPLVLSSESN